MTTAQACAAPLHRASRPTEAARGSGDSALRRSRNGRDAHDEPELAILSITDRNDESDALAELVRSLGCSADAVSTAEAALARVRLSAYDLVFCSARLGTASGVDLIPRLLRVRPHLRIIVSTASGQLETVVEAMRAGASDVVQEPVRSDTVRRLVEGARSEAPHAVNGEPIADEAVDGPDKIFLTSKSPAMQLAFAIIARAAVAEVAVLLRGETGTGKGVLAHTLHAQSRRSDKPFITVSCPSLSDDLLISELFGHAKGSFTGAIRDKAGLVDAADGGTLFLDEVGDLSPTVQAKLLRFLQDHAYERLGETTTRIANVRIVAATNRDLEAQVKSGHFREDLLYRLNVVEVIVPPLRERRADIIDLARHFIGIASVHLTHPTPVLSPGAEQMLTAYAWPGNIRELCNEVQRVIVLWPSRMIEAESFSSRLVPIDAPGPILGDRHSLAAIESEHIRLVLSKTDRFDEAAAILGIQLSTLWRKRRKLGLCERLP
jgi:NtrC-family two-component system response regulator AlgB